MIRNLAVVAGGLLWGLAVFVAGLHLAFPSDAALERLRWELDQRSDGAYGLEASGASLWRATGLYLEDVNLLRIEKPPRKRSGDEDEPTATAERVFSASGLGARLRLIPLLSGTADIGCVAELYGGQLDGHVALAGEELQVQALLEGIDLRRIPFEGEVVSLDLGGKLEGEADLKLEKTDLSKTSGKLKLAVEDLVLHSGKAMGFELLEEGEESAFSKAELAFKIDKGKAKLTKGVFTGDLLDASLDGEITLKKNFSSSRLRLGVEFTLEENLDKLIGALPGPRDARDEDGKYHFQLTGTLLHPNFRPNSPRRGSARRSGVSERRPGMMPDDDETSGDIEERRRLREERIRERRERLKSRRDEARKRRDDGESASRRRPTDEADELDELGPGEALDDEFYDDAEPFDEELDNGEEQYDDVDLREAPYEDDGYDEYGDEGFAD